MSAIYKIGGEVVIQRLLEITVTFYPTIGQPCRQVTLRCPPHDLVVLNRLCQGCIVNSCSVSDPWFAFGALMKVVFDV